MIQLVPAMSSANVSRLLPVAVAYLITAVCTAAPVSVNTACADPPGEPSLVRGPPIRVNHPNAAIPPSPNGNQSPSTSLTSSQNVTQSPNPFLPPAAGTAATSNVQPAAAWNSIPPRRDSGSEVANGAITNGALLNGAASRTSEQPPLELKAPGATEDPRVKAPRSPWAATLSMTLSLTLVVCLFLIAVLMLRKSQPKQFQKLPNEVIEVLGRSTMGPRQQLYVLRFGSKLILVSQQPGETQALGEITDHEESERLAGLCEANRPESISNSFKEVFRHVVTSSSKQSLPKQHPSKPSRT